MSSSISKCESEPILDQNLRSVLSGNQHRALSGQFLRYRTTTFYIASLIPARTRNQFMGYVVAKPIIIPICIMNQ